MIRIVVTGARGLLGWHCAARLHARNCAATFRGEARPFEIVAIDRESFNDSARLGHALAGAEAVLHFAGVNRGTDEEVERGNCAIAERLATCCREVGETPHIVYANSTHANLDSPYGRSKRQAAEILALPYRASQISYCHTYSEKGPGPFTITSPPPLFIRWCPAMCRLSIPRGRYGCCTPVRRPTRPSAPPSVA